MGGAGPPPRDVDRMVSLKVDNISYRLTSEELQRYFEKYGRVGDVYIPRDPRTRESRGFAFVRFYSKHDAEDAMDRMDGKLLDGREIRVSMARYPRPVGGGGDERNGRDGRGRRGRSRSRSRSRSRERRRSRSHSKSSFKGRSSDSNKRSPSKSRSRSRGKAFDDGSREGSRSRSR